MLSQQHQQLARVLLSVCVMVAAAAFAAGDAPIGEATTVGWLLLLLVLLQLLRGKVLGGPLLLLLLRFCLWAAVEAAPAAGEKAAISLYHSWGCSSCCLC